LRQWRELGVYVTAIGEQRSVILDDGTRMLLNTATRARVDFRPEQRTVEIQSGEALFAVAKDASRPFVVRGGGSEVVAIGTVFSVRLGDASSKNEALTVTLVEGRVKVRAVAAGAGLAPKQDFALKPGDRLTLDRGAYPSAPDVEARLDRPNLDSVMAWQHHDAVFDATPLVDAIAEFNRYSRTQISLSTRAQSANYLMSGVYRTGDSAAFAQAVAALYGLTVRDLDGRLELDRP
jgi:transmembrane sensor